LPASFSADGLEKRKQSWQLDGGERPQLRRFWKLELRGVGQLAGRGYRSGA
jgi:hypothetical protein